MLDKKSGSSRQKANKRGDIQRSRTLKKIALKILFYAVYFHMKILRFRSRVEKNIIDGDIKLIDTLSSRD